MHVANLSLSFVDVVKMLLHDVAYVYMYELFTY